MQIIPIVRNLSTIQHLAENTIRIGSASVGALEFFFGYPCVHYDFSLGVKPKEQPMLLEEFGSKPVCVLTAKGFSQSELSTGRILRNDIEHQLS